MTKEELLQDIYIHVNNLNDFEIINKLKDLNPSICNTLLLEARAHLKIALYEKLTELK